jgi:putative ABC transport system permease protein
MNEGGRIERMSGTPEPLWQVLEDEFEEVVASVRYVPFRRILTSDEGESFNMGIAYVEDNFLDIFDFTVVEGNAEDILNDPLSMVITETTAKRLFGDEDVIGQSYKADGVVHTVTGIIKDPPSNSHINFEILISINTLTSLFGDDTFTHWGNNWVCLYVLMQEEHDIESFNSKIQFLLKKHYYEETLNELDTRPLLDIHLYSDLADDYAIRSKISNIYVLMAIAVFILIMAGVNFTNLAVAYNSLRIREVGIRKINGGSRRLLLIQLLGESLTMSLISVLLAFVIFETFLPLFNQLVSRDLNFHYLQNMPLFALILFIGLITGMLSALYPAIILSGFQPVQILQAKSKEGKDGPVLRRTLVGLQFLISAVLIISTLGVVRQASYMKNKDLGYNPRNVIHSAFNDTSWIHANTFRDILLENPHIIDVSYHDYPVCQSDNWTRVSWEGAESGEWIRMNVNYVDPHYLNTYQMRLIDGEGFTESQIGSQESIPQLVLNSAAVKRIGIEDPVGKHIRYGGDYRLNNIGNVRIVGVVDDYHFISVHNVITPIMIRLFNERTNPQSISIRLDGIKMQETLEFVSAKFAEYYPKLPFRPDFVYDFHARMYAEEGRMSNIVLALAILAIIIACLGVYGLVAFTTSNRTGEVGIRKVMGAGFYRIARLFSKEFLILICISNLLAWPVGYFLVKNWLQSFPYKVGFSIAPYLAALFLTIIFAMLSMLYHIYRSNRMQPADSLRYE